MRVLCKNNLASFGSLAFNYYKQTFSAENVANFSLICIFPLLFLYQFLIAQFPGKIEPVFGSGWAIVITTLFFWLSYFYTIKFLLQRNELLFLDYIFVAFLSFVCLVSLLHYFGPFKAQYNEHLLSGIYLALPQTLLVIWRFA